MTMFTMNKYVTPHLLEKLDKSYYTHEDVGEDGAVSKDDGSECSESTHEL